jgi:predicted nucleotidyltransferase
MRMDGHRLVERHTIYACVVGSRAYGLSRPGSDTDRRGVYAAPAASFWGLTKPPSHVDGPGEDQFSWEVERFCELGLQANPTVLEVLWSPLVTHIDDAGRALVGLRSAFLSQRAAQTYGGYARDQLTRLENSRRRFGELRWKQAMHMLRLLLAGVHVLRTGEVMVNVGEHRDRLLAVRRGEVPYEEVARWAAELEGHLARALSSTPVPVDPDRDAVSEFLVRLRRASACP